MVLLFKKKKITFLYVHILMTAEKVMKNLAGMTSQVAPCDVSSVHGIRRAMGIAAPHETSESFINLTTGDRLTLNDWMWDLKRHLLLLLIYFSARDGWADGGSAHTLRYTSCHHSVIRARLRKIRTKKKSIVCDICLNFCLIKCLKYALLLLSNGKKTAFITSTVQSSVSNSQSMKR